MLHPLLSFYLLLGNGNRLPGAGCVAGTLSAVLPGAGQLYAGRTKDGIIAFIVNGLFIAGAIEAYHRENYVACGVLALFEVGWYSGNVYSAVNSAHRFNDERRSRRMLELKKKMLELKAEPKKKSLKNLRSYETPSLFFFYL